jgi:hypothetical protein
MYANRMATLSQEDNQRIFAEYVADAQKRIEHDQQFPDEPKQVQPGENIKMEDGHFQVSGAVAVMAINERLLRALMAKNPDLSFALQESFPLKGTHADALPLGPVMELRALNDQNPFSADRATEFLDYWRTTAQNVLGDPQIANSENALKAYSHDANSAANLLAAHNYTAQAEQTYQLAGKLWPGNLEAVEGLAAIYAGSARAEEARQLLDDFARKYPDQRAAIEAAGAGISILWTGPTRTSPGK